MQKVFIFASGQNTTGNPEATSPVGELSAYGRSFSKYVQDIANPSLPNITLSVFGNTINSTDLTKVILVVANINNLITQNTSLTFTYLNTYILSNFNITLIATGNKVNLNNTVWFDYITVSCNGILYTVACSDEVWRQIYSNYEIDVIPPIDVQALRGSYNSVKNALGNVTSASIFEKINVSKKKYNETSIMPTRHDYAPAGLPSLAVTWYCLVYGPQGEVKEAIDSAIASYLEHIAVVDIWKPLFPSLYNKREIYIVPLWNSVTNAGSIGETIYRSSMLHSDVISTAIAACDDMDEDYVKASALVLPTAYKFINCILVPTQYIDLTVLLSLINDYISVTPTSSDFAKMRTATQQLSLILYSLLSKAEQFSDYGINTAPVVLKNNKRYLTSSYNDITLFMEIKT